MARIYLGLAFVAMALLLTNVGLGFWTGEYGEVVDRMLAEGEKLRSVEGDAKAGRLAKDAPDYVKQQAAFDAAVADWQRLRPRTATHMLLGIAAALVAMLVNSISVTYFIGTSRWVREVVETYQLGEGYIRESLQLKRKAFPWALGSMLLIIVLVAFGALSDPAAGSQQHLSWRTWHYLLAVFGSGFLGLAFYAQQQSIGANYRIIERILADVRRIRVERGLDVEAAA